MYLISTLLLLLLIVIGCIADILNRLYKDVHEASVASIRIADSMQEINTQLYNVAVLIQRREL